MLLPPSCSICGAPGAAPCAACHSLLSPAPALPPPPGADTCAALLAYEGAGRELVARIKYRNRRSAVAWLAEGMAGLVAGAGPFDAVTCVPASRRRSRAAGFDHARLLAEAVACRLGVGFQPLLERFDRGTQTGRSRRERLAGPRLVVPRRRLVPPRVLLVDDVVTTGATMRAASVALRTGGATRVVAVAAAWRPPPITQGARR